MGHGKIPDIILTVGFIVLFIRLKDFFIADSGLLDLKMKLNLMQGMVTEDTLRQIFGQIFDLIPAFAKTKGPAVLTCELNARTTTAVFE